MDCTGGWKHLDDFSITLLALNFVLFEMMEIRVFNETLDLTQINAHFTDLLALIAIIVAITFGYLNYRKKAASTFENCIFNIQSLNSNELSDEKVVKKINDCVNKNVPKFIGQIVKDTTFELSKNELILLNSIREKTDEYFKESGKTIKNANVLRTLGNEIYYLGKPEKALEYYQQALEIDEELKDIRGKAIDLNNIGLVYQDWGKTEKALEYYQQALAIDEELKDIRGKATRLNNIGGVYQDWGKTEKALEYYQQALEIDEKLKDIRD